MKRNSPHAAKTTPPSQFCHLLSTKMSKRKADEISAETNNGGDGVTRSGIEDAKAPVPETFGWSGLPPELVRRVGQLQDDPKSLAVMERTCKSWRKVSIEGNDGGDMGDTPCLWRDLALAKFPRLTPLVEAVRARSKADPKHSWKGLYRVNSEAKRRCDARSNAIPHVPTTALDDYFHAVEFRRGVDLLFVTSGTSIGHSSGAVIFRFENWTDFGGGVWDIMNNTQSLTYLETQCPWL